MRLSVAGFAATAVTFGPARIGYGLFLPYFRDDFGLSTGLLGLVAGGLYFGYLVALSLVGALSSRVGPLAFIVMGLVSAAVGMTLVAFAGNATVLAAGVVLAGSSAGWSWAPYNESAERKIPDTRQRRVLSVISTGTTFGIVATGVTALLVGGDWRIAWLAFAVAALVALVPNLRTLRWSPARDHDGSATAPHALGGAWRRFVGPVSVPLFIVAGSFGFVSAFYFSFAVDLIVAGGIARTFGGPVLYTLIGAAGLGGLATGDAIERFGQRRVLLAALASLSGAAFLLGAAPSSWLAIGVSASLFGLGVMVTSALLAIWSEAVFPMRPSAGFSATLFVFGVGLTLGPVLLSALDGPFGLDTAFLVAGSIALSTAFVKPKSS